MLIPRRLQKKRRLSPSLFALWLFLATSTVQAKGNENSVDPALSTHSSYPATITLQAPKKEGTILVFISSAMPQASLIQWFTQAKQLGAAIVLRGFVNNSLPSTKAWLKPLFEHTENQGGIEINPVAFRAYGIVAVPAVVVTTGHMECSSDQDCSTPPFDVVTGNTSLLEALKTISERGDVGKLIAKERVERSKEAT